MKKFLIFLLLLISLSLFSQVMYGIWQYTDDNENVIIITFYFDQTYRTLNINTNEFYTNGTWELIENALILSHDDIIEELVIDWIDEDNIIACIINTDNCIIMEKVK